MRMSFFAPFRHQPLTRSHVVGGELHRSSGWCNRFSASSRHRDLNKSATNIPIEYRIAIIGSHHAMILPDEANPGRIELSERTISCEPYPKGTSAALTNVEQPVE
jgi:hypothetical protein